ncbi:oxoglutarate iron-dependent oxygenase [Seiridium cupressi]
MGNSAPMSKQWQPHIERITFAEVYLSPARLAAARKILTPMRFGDVRSIHLDVVLDDYSKQTRRYVGNEKENVRNNDVFTRTVAGIFSLLKPLDVPKSIRGPRTLQLTAHSPSDELLLEEARRLRYNGANVLEEEDIRLRRRLLDDSSKSLQLLPLSLKHLILVYLRKPPKNYLFNLNDKLLETYGPDPLSTTLRNLPQRLVTVDLAGPIYPTNDCFCSSSFSEAEEPEWRRLETLSLDTSAAIPKGHWLFDRHAEYKALVVAGGG